MTSAKQSKSVRYAGKSSASPAGANAVGIIARIAARSAAACDLLGLPRGRATIVVACSGGADSGAALHVVRRARPAAQLIACYVDHRMRSPAQIAADRRAVRAQARESKATAKFLRLGERPHKGESVEAALRQQRYRALAFFARSVGATCVVTGHQRDDLAESALLALTRGSGVDGIAAMRPRRSIGQGVDLVRPLLWAPKRALEEYAEAAGLPASEDETNEDQRYRRNAVRRLLQGLESIAPGSSGAIARSAAIAVEDKALLDAVTAAAWARTLTADGQALRAAELRKLPSSLLRRVLRYAIKRATGSTRDFSYDHAIAIARAVKEGRGGSHHAGRARIVLSGGRAVVVDASVSKKAAAPPLRVTVPRTSAVIEWGEGQVALRMRRPHAVKTRRITNDARLLLDGVALAPGTALTIRFPEKGDRFVPSGRRSEVSLAKFLAKAGLSRDERRSVPLLCSNGTVVAALGVRAGAAFIARPGSAVLEVCWTTQNTASPTHSSR
jgi:tRNA(Ile)-lysidine synthase